MIEGKLIQHEEIADAVVSTINFYSPRLNTRLEGKGVAELMAAAQAWSEKGPEELIDDELARRSSEVAVIIRELFEDGYQGAYQGDWLDVDTNGFDLDPCGYLQEIGEGFGMAQPPYGTNRELVAYVAARYKPR